uniref:DNA repair protein-like protein n=1 Tax=Podoviridae sp. ct7Kl21 TaxID=2826541 RepID=A0A8S5MCS5_9CAUD|nr:MAG TPA: DNA repair protein-like protein [Podoviridae sp. ct7Kl21]
MQKKVVKPFLHLMYYLTQNFTFGIPLVADRGLWYNNTISSLPLTAGRGGRFMGIHDGHREKMRRRFLQGGLDTFADHEALELLLFYAIPRRDTNPIAHALMERYGSLSAVLSAPVEDLQKVEGIGESAAILLRLAPLLTRKARLAEREKETVLNSSERAGKYLLERFAGEKHEVIYQLCLDRKGKLLACKRLGEGGVAGADLNIRLLVSNALLTSASAVILSHNHPSGVALPSPDDYATTDRAKEALATIGVALADHIIVADGDFVSMSDSGYLA